MPSVEVVGRPYAAQIANRTSEVHVVAGDHEAITLPAEPADARAIFGGQAISDVHCEQPELIEVRLVQCRQERIALTATGAISGRHHASWSALRVLEF